MKSPYFNLIVEGLQTRGYVIQKHSTHAEPGAVVLRSARTRITYIVRSNGSVTSVMNKKRAECCH